jgi:uncharacterized protein (DUF983 family)
MSVTPSEKEEEFFARQEFEKRKKLREEYQRKLKEQERKELRELHHMHCPKCGMGLIEIDYKGVKLDKCSECGGLWFDAKEFETILSMEKAGVKKVFSVFGSK